MNFIPTDEQWEKMKKHIKSDKYSKEDFFVFETRAVGDRVVPHRYTRLMPELLEVMKDDAQKGVSLMLNHNEGQLGVQAIPVGKVFDARIDGSSQEGETTTLYTTQYIHRDDSKIDGYSKNDIIDLIETGVLSDTSVGFMTDPVTSKCSICGNSIYDWKNCKHIPGAKYITDEEKNTVEQCIVEVYKPTDVNMASEGNNVLCENSLVYDGAYSNAVIQSRFSNDNKSEMLKVLEGKQNLSPNDKIIGFSSKSGIDLYYTHLEEKGGVEMANKDEETVDNVEEVEESVEEENENSAGVDAEEVIEVTEEAEETSGDASEVVEGEEDISAGEEEVHESSETDSESGELFTEANILDKFENIADSIEGLVQLAKEGLENRNEVIKQALDSGVHSMGNAFNKEIFEKTFSSMSTKDIKEMADAWEENAKAQFSDKKISKAEYTAKPSKSIVEEKEYEITDYSKFKTDNY